MEPVEGRPREFGERESPKEKVEKQQLSLKSSQTIVSNNVTQLLYPNPNIFPNIFSSFTKPVKAGLQTIDPPYVLPHVPYARANPRNSSEPRPEKTPFQISEKARTMT